jgi:hypothetical protein
MDGDIGLAGEASGSWSMPEESEETEDESDTD